jgi:hypothetical protein
MAEPFCETRPQGQAAGNWDLSAAQLVSRSRINAPERTRRPREHFREELLKAGLPVRRAETGFALPETAAICWKMPGAAGTG